jgi:GNAT superfamily N-acetyltransferase
MLHIRLMTGLDVPLGMRLKEQAGWNQTEADWRRCLDLQPDGCFVALWDGAPVGTAAACVFGAIAWVAMVLVDAAFRGRGVGRALLDHTLAFLDGRGVPTVRLDATPLGRPLYAKLGFVEEYTLARYEGVPASSACAGEDGPVVPAGTEHLEDVLRLDRDVTGTDRQALLRRLFAERPGDWRVAVEGGEVVGYSARRAGSRAWQIGPILGTPAAGPELLADAWHRLAGQPVFVDVPLTNSVAVAAAEGLGLVVQRPLFRMCRGPRPAECIERLWASFGPEKG